MADQMILDAQRDTDGSVERLLALRTDLRAKFDELCTRRKELAAKKAALAAANAGSDVKPTDKIKLNVGGSRITTTRETLTHFRGTRLAALFSGRWEAKLQRDRKGRIFFDLNPSVFKKILDYHQFAKIAPPEDPPPKLTAPFEMEALLAAQIDFLGLSDVCAPIRPRTQKEEEEEGMRRSKRRRTEEEEEAASDTHGSRASVLPSEASRRPLTDQAFCTIAARVAQALETEARALNAAIDAQTREEEVHANEQDFVAFFCGDTKDVVDLNVTGERMSAKRSTLRMVANSPLACKFDAQIWPESTSAAGDDSDDEGMSIDFSAYCFGAVLDHLRLLAVASYTGSTVPLPSIRADQKDNFARLVKYYFPGQEDTFIPPVPELNLTLQGFGTQVDNSALPKIVTHRGIGGLQTYACALSTSILPPMAVWKVKITNTTTGGSTWGMAGVIGNPAPVASSSHTDPTSYGWAVQPFIAGKVVGKNSPGHGGWTGWTLNDEAIFKLDTVESALKMWHKRLGRMFTISLPPRSEGWRLHIGLHGTNITRIHVTIPSADEMQLFQ